MEQQTAAIRFALFSNALLSAAVGLLLALGGSSVSSWLGLSIAGWLQLLGVALVGHAIALVLAAARRDRSRWARVNLALIAPYPLLMIALVAFGVVTRPLGVALVLLDAAAVGVMAYLHLSGLRQAPSVVHAPSA